MRRFATLVLTMLFAANSGAIEPDLSDSEALEAFVDGIVMPLMKNENSPSGTVAIAYQGELVFAKGYGFEDIERQIPVDPHKTMFRTGSTSKLFTWVSVMQLVELGELDLDVDVNTYLETFKIKDTFEQPITLRHIMTHTAGFEDGGIGYLIVDDPDKIMPLSESLKRYQPERVNPPGVQTAYSNYATALAGLIVENVSGVPFNDYLQQNIFDPLKMINTTFAEPLPSRFEGQMAKSYKAGKGTYTEKPFEIIANFGPAGAQSATSTDMIRFAQAILNGGELDGNRILETDTVEQMLAPSFSHDERLMGMLLGFYATDYNGNRVIGHGGDTQWFHSYLGLDKENELALFVSFGGSGGRVPRYAVTTGVYDQYFPRSETPPPVPPEDFSERAGKYAGVYAFWRGNFSKIERVFGISSVVQVAPTEDNTLLLAFATGAKQYVEIEENLFRERDANLSLVAGISPRQIAFQEDANGNVTGFVMDGLPFMSLRKLSAYATPSFNYSLLGFSLLVLLFFALRRFFQRREIALLGDADRSAINAGVYASVSHLAVVILGVVVITIIQDDLFGGFPLLFKLWLVLPIVASLATLYLAFKTVQVWRQSSLAGVWARIRFTVVTLSALFMFWFYWYWNILGYQYL